jgi:hypothetical protein
MHTAYLSTLCETNVAIMTFSGGSGFKSKPGSDELLDLMMEAASISETPVNFYQDTWRNNPEGNPHTVHRQNLKSHLLWICLFKTHCFTVI